MLILLPIFEILFVSDIKMAVSDRGPENDLVFHDHAFLDCIGWFFSSLSSTFGLSSTSTSRPSHHFSIQVTLLGSHTISLYDSMSLPLKPFIEAPRSKLSTPSPYLPAAAPSQSSSGFSSRFLVRSFINLLQKF